jgi:hypothetical protein
MTEIWTAVAVLSLAVGAIAGGLAAFRRSRVWDRIFAAIRATSVVALTVALLGRVATLGQWSLYDQQLSVLGLALAMLLVHSLLAWLLKGGMTAPLVELAGLGLLIGGAARLPAGTPLLTCPQNMAPLQIQWVLFLLGGGSLLTAGCMGLSVVVGRAVQTRAWKLHLAASEDLYALLVQAAMLALVSLGSGLIVSLWWASQTLGSLTGGDPRIEWMALAWLLTAMTLLAGQLERNARWWVIGLALLAAFNMLFGWLLLVGVQDLLGF